MNVKRGMSDVNSLRAIANTYRRVQKKVSTQIPIFTFHRHCLRYGRNLQRMCNVWSRFTVSSPPPPRLEIISFAYLRMVHQIVSIFFLPPLLSFLFFSDTYRGPRKHFSTTNGRVDEETNTYTASACCWTDPLYTLSPSPFFRHTDDLSLENRTYILVFISYTLDNARL